ncbi:MFS transporter [Singulisphaera sp. PoT]|uniref:MFS transporter n=1 Tax=Singulisphaera sp. PoT TaxID=3411797 RepID=UPI003BF4E9F4
MYARTRWRLSGMMALLYAVQGAFWPILAVHLHELGIDGRQRGRIFATLAIGSFLMPLGAGQLVDRLMATQNFLAIVYALGTTILVALACGVTSRPEAIFGWFLAYWLITAPATGLATSLALRNLRHAREEFGAVRLWGTIGWMAIGWAVTAAMLMTGSAHSGQGTYVAFWIASALSLVMSLYCLTLPNTPPLAATDPAGNGLREALALVRQREVAVLLATALGVGLTTPFVYQVLPTFLVHRGLPRGWVTTVMTLGQVPEVAALAILPGLFHRLRTKWTLALGILAYALRYGSLAIDPPLWLAIAGIPLHGIGIACFTVGAQVFIDSRAPSHRRAGAQALLLVLTAGIGPLLGSLIAGESALYFGSGHALVFVVPCVLNVLMLAAFVLAFRPGLNPGNSHATEAVTGEPQREPLTVSGSTGG